MWWTTKLARGYWKCQGKKGHRCLWQALYLAASRTKPVITIQNPQTMVQPLLCSSFLHVYCNISLCQVWCLWWHCSHVFLSRDSCQQLRCIILEIVWGKKHKITFKLPQFPKHKKPQFFFYQCVVPEIQVKILHKLTV